MQMIRIRIRIRIRITGLSKARSKQAVRMMIITIMVVGGRRQERTSVQDSEWVLLLACRTMRVQGTAAEAVSTFARTGSCLRSMGIGVRIDRCRLDRGGMSAYRRKL